MSKDNYHGQRCLNCGSQLTGPYCSECGQKHIAGNLTSRYFIDAFLEAITNTDSRAFRTLKDLILYPGYVAKRYVTGSRQYYVNPLRLCFLIIGAYLAILALNGWISPVVDSSLAQQNMADKESSVFSVKFYKVWYDLYSNHRLFIYLGAMPVAAIAIRYAFYQSGYNYIATLTMLLYAGSLYSLYGILVVVTFLIFNVDFFSMSRKMIEIIIGLIVYYQSVKLFYSFGWIKSLFSTLWIFILLTVAAYLVTFAASGLIANWH
ncbi:DUF3667 domain-containing protein [Aliikangiella marina]|uniref:DUF3667 domain-containing protein n=1 Tax=Aliikangiella marina TaxID=1712262 RepID=A0A545TJ44_9GAMM|nr:DUF3667 domain-containing protein [Aliikangiella marina]TQV77191.1 DUF3667 domain-containing protein [Aliikangiella marina]